VLSRGAASSRNGERQLCKLYRTLASEDRVTLLAFAEFLTARSAEAEPDAQEGLLEPKSSPRPSSESVVGAIKRLSKNYYMLDRSAMLNDTSSLMGAHVLQGRPASAVIDELEALFSRYYEEYREQRENKGS
jgi:hypothetical protein